jgi:pimeloyl-ACP methyl ester carboxylesterase
VSMPLTFLVLWLAGLLSLALLGGGAYLVWAWYVGEVVETGWLAVGVALLLWSVSGRPLVLLTRRRGADEPRSERGGRARRVAGPDGSDLHVEEHGPAQGAPTLLLTHGWDLDATAWWYEKKHLADRFRLVLWDLPGLGLSRQPADGRYSLERMAWDLRAVLDAAAGGRPVVLVGHSIGGMTILTFCRLFPALLGREVAGIVLVNTTYTMPLNTILAGGLLRAALARAGAAALAHHRGLAPGLGDELEELPRRHGAQDHRLDLLQRARDPGTVGLRGPLHRKAAPGRAGQGHPGDAPLGRDRDRARHRRPDADRHQRPRQAHPAARQRGDAPSDPRLRTGHGQTGGAPRLPRTQRRLRRGDRRLRRALPRPRATASARPRPGAAEPPCWGGGPCRRPLVGRTAPPTNPWRPPCDARLARARSTGPRSRAPSGRSGRPGTTACEGRCLRCTAASRYRRRRAGRDGPGRGA